jgi:CubicO group peptidase (beta-lactamase class C family)
VLLGAASAGAAPPTPQSVRPEQVGMSSERLRLLDEALQRSVAEQAIPGAVTVVARRGQVVYLSAVGWRDREAHAPMRVDSMFRVASQTKSVVAVAVMMLQEEGKLRIGDPVSRYIPEFARSRVAVVRPNGAVELENARREITIRDLLTHTSGLGYGMGPTRDAWTAAGFHRWYFADQSETMDRRVRAMAELPLDAQPGERYVYGYSYDVLGVLVERVSGQTLERFLQQRIFGPLGMRDTRFYVPPAQKDRLAVVYASDEAGGLRRLPDDGPGLVSQGAYVSDSGVAFSGGAGLVSTAPDYLRFLQMLLNGGTLDGQRILSRKTIEIMTVNHLHGLEFRPGEGVGLGFTVVTDLGDRGLPGSVGEFAGAGAYHSTWWIDPREQLIVLYLTQTLPARNNDDYASIRALVYQAITQ